MSPHDTPMPDARLHAYVDGELPAADLPGVLDWLAAHPEDAARVRDWQAQRLALRRLARETVLDETPEALLRPLQAQARRQRLWQGARLAAACLLALGLGVVAGRHWDALDAAGGGPAGALAATPAFVRDAAAAHAAFVPERKHPVEVTAADEAHLVQWLSRRLGTALRAPDLLGEGFHLLGGRLLPGEALPGAALPGAAPATVPRAQFMYEDAEGRRLTLYVAVFPDAQAPAPTAFRQQHGAGQDSFYWTDERLGYALSAAPGLPLARLAAEVHRQLAR